MGRLPVLQPRYPPQFRLGALSYLTNLRQLKPIYFVLGQLSLLQGKSEKCAIR